MCPYFMYAESTFILSPDVDVVLKAQLSLKQRLQSELYIDAVAL